MRHSGRLLLLICMGLVPPAARAETPAPPASEARTETVRTMADLIANIATARDIDSAAADYARARAIDKKSVLLFQAYMKRTLTLGRPSVAFYPAMDLTQLTPDNGLAWSVIGYCHGKRRKMLWALTSTMKALELLPEDGSIQNNAGLCLAWYESLSPGPKLSPKLTISLRKDKPKWLEKEAFAAAHKAAAGSLHRRREKMAALDKLLKERSGRIRERLRELADIDAAYKNCEHKIADHEASIRHLKKMAAKRDVHDGHRKRKGERSWREIEDHRDEIRDLKDRNDDRRRDADKLKKRIREARKDISEAKAELHKVTYTRIDYDWRPPIVDGKPIDDLDGVAAATKKRPVASQPHSPPSLETQIRMAVMLIRNNRRPQALMALKQILKDHPNTDAAKRARELILKHKLAPDI